MSDDDATTTGFTTGFGNQLSGHWKRLTPLPEEPAPEREITSWEDLIDDPSWLDDDDDDDDDWDNVDLDVATETPQPSETTEPTVRSVRELMDSAHTEQELIELFPDIDVDVALAERIDDLVPDIENTTQEALEHALLAATEAMDECARLKMLAQSGLYGSAERAIKKKIRAAKSSVVNQRGTITRKLDALAAAAKAKAAASATSTSGSSGFGSWASSGSSSSSSSGFAGFGSSNYRAEAQRAAKERYELNKRTNEYVFKTMQDIHKKRQAAFEKQNKAWNNMMFPRRYY